MTISLEWNDTLCVGHPAIDAQHREIFTRFGTLLEACNQGRASESLRELFAFLDDYVQEHFAIEEELMSRYGYPQRDAHLAEHGEFVRHLADLKQELETSGISPLILIRTNKALIYWLTHHIQSIDSG
ncbi:MAG: hemerythrin, partial [Desulfuromonas sp.]